MIRHKITAMETLFLFLCQVIYRYEMPLFDYKKIEKHLLQMNGQF